MSIEIFIPDENTSIEEQFYSVLDIPGCYWQWVTDNCGNNPRIVVAKTLEELFERTGYNEVLGENNFEFYKNLSDTWFRGYIDITSNVLLQLLAIKIKNYVENGVGTHVSVAGTTLKEIKNDILLSIMAYKEPIKNEIKELFEKFIANNTDILQ